MNDKSNLINDYKEYINSLINKGFDFNTWCQHQYGESPTNIIVEPKLEFNIISYKNKDK